MTRLYRTDQELNSLTKVRQSHVLYSRFVLNPIQLEGSRRPLRLGSHVMLSKDFPLLWKYRPSSRISLPSSLSADTLLGIVTISYSRVGIWIPSKRPLVVGGPITSNLNCLLCVAVWVKVLREGVKGGFSSSHYGRAILNTSVCLTRTESYFQTKDSTHIGYPIIRPSKILYNKSVIY